MSRLKIEVLMKAGRERDVLVAMVLGQSNAVNIELYKEHHINMLVGGL